MMHQDPQQLVVLLNHLAVKLIFLVAHAPTLDKTEELQQWWKQVDVQLRMCPNWPVISLIDANSRVGLPSSDSIGDFGATQENIAGAWFHEWLIRNKYWMPSTFSECHSGDHNTWFHANGAAARLAYVTLSQDFKNTAVQTWVSQDVDLSITRLDHLLVSCRLDIWISDDKSMPQAHRARSSQSSKFANDLQTPQLPWSLNVHEHANNIEEGLRRFVNSPSDFEMLYVRKDWMCQG